MRGATTYCDCFEFDVVCILLVDLLLIVKNITDREHEIITVGEKRKCRNEKDTYRKREYMYDICFFEDVCVCVRVYVLR